MYIQRNLTGSPEVFFDPNKLSEDATVSLTSYTFSEDGKHFAYCVSKSGSDWNTLHIKDVETGTDYPEILKDVKFPSISWTFDHKGFFYNRYTNIEGKADGTETTSHKGQKIYYHVLGTDQSQDEPVIHLDNPSLGLDTEMLRFNKFTIAYYSESEFGTPQNKTQFHNILSYSPLHNIRVPPNNTQYPATLLLTGDHDDRVPPLHSYKFIAALQDKIGSLPYQKNPLMVRVESNAGHGHGTPLMKSIDEMTDILIFLMKSIGLKYYP
ncbi:hypothetical protein WDU94_014508 [Cyamophila willieti]